MGPTMIPQLKEKVDELFLHWFSEVETQQQLRKELNTILGNTQHHEIQAVTTPSLTSSPQGGHQNTLSIRPNSPPIHPGSPTTPRSPRRRTSSDLSHKGSRRSIKRLPPQDEQKPSIYPGCAENLKPFYFPFGEPKKLENEDNIVNNITACFGRLKKNVATLDDFPQLMKVCLVEFIFGKTFLKRDRI